MGNDLRYSWIRVPAGNDFPLQNIPFGIFSNNENSPRPATRIGNTVVDLSVLADHGFFDDLEINDLSVFYQPILNDFIALGKPVTGKVRELIMTLFASDNPMIKENLALQNHALYPVHEVKMQMPVSVGDYTDFYSSEEHATNVGRMFRDPANALLPNWKHIPVGYHGRASSIVVSGTPIHRPKGQTKADDKSFPDFGPTQQLDFELEIGFIVGGNTDLGTSISTSNAEDYIFGLVLFNDLSARDIQKWEYVPLGPFLSKNFGSVISPWIVTLEALEPFRAKGPVQDPEVLPYLKFEGARNYDIQLEVAIEPPAVSRLPERDEVSGKDAMLVCRSNFKYMYWNMCQQLAHHTVNGCNVRTGDICASGTISGPDEGSFGSMLELTWKGTRPIRMPDGSERKFLHDGDTVIMRGRAEKNGLRIGFGEATTIILPPKD
ncbi:MAG: fumarylacetoacetase [Bacteroidales bacterium]|nr:fumarylacetoacetase [Bacteroidales bacterium]